MNRLKGEKVNNILAIILLIGCDSNDISIPPEPKPPHKFRCSSKSAGSTPQCWNDEDWKEFCKRVSCKENNLEKSKHRKEK